MVVDSSRHISLNGRKQSKQIVRHSSSTRADTAWTGARVQNVFKYFIFIYECCMYRMYSTRAHVQLFSPYCRKITRNTNFPGGKINSYA